MPSVARYGTIAAARERETAMDLQPVGARRHIAGSMRQRLGHEVLETRRSRMTAPGR